MGFSIVSGGIETQMTDLAAALGESVIDDGTYYKIKIGSSPLHIRRKKTASSGSIYLEVGNMNYSSSVLTQSSNLCVYFNRQKTVYAIGNHSNSGQNYYSIIIAEDEKGNMGAFSYKPNTSSAANNVFYMINENSNVSNKLDLKANFYGDAEISTSITKCPNFYGGAMFKDLYLVLSTPYSGKSAEFSMGGRTYRLLGATDIQNFIAFAFEIDD